MKCFILFPIHHLYLFFHTHMILIFTILIFSHFLFKSFLLFIHFDLIIDPLLVSFPCPCLLFILQNPSNFLSTSPLFLVPSYNTSHLFIIPFPHCLSFPHQPICKIFSLPMLSSHSLTIHPLSPISLSSFILTACFTSLFSVVLFFFPNSPTSLPVRSPVLL